MTTPHGGHAISTRTGGALAAKISATTANLELVPAASRTELWAAAWGGVLHAKTLLAEGRRAKAGKILASAIAIVHELT